MSYPSYQPAMNERIKMQMQMFYNNMPYFGGAAVNTSNGHERA